MKNGFLHAQSQQGKVGSFFPHILIHSPSPYLKQHLTLVVETDADTTSSTLPLMVMHTLYETYISLSPR
jgi:hypothetical protein